MNKLAFGVALLLLLLVPMLMGQKKKPGAPSAATLAHGNI